MTSEQKLLQVPDHIADSKVYKKMVKEFGEEETASFFKKSESELRAVMAECQVQMTEAKQQVEENNEWKKAKAILKTFSGGLRDAIKPLKLKANAAAVVVAYNNEVRRAK
jgi:hypothetical protein